MAATAAYNSSVLIASLPSVAFTNEATTSTDQITYTISTAAHRYFDKSVPVVVQSQNDEVQLVTITGGPTGGTFTLSFGGNTSAGIAYNASAATVQSALQALASIGSGNATVTGSTGGPYTVEFTGAKGFASQALMTASGALTGGTTPSVTVARSLAGQGWLTETTPYTLYRANARIVFGSAQTGTTQVRFASGNYFPYATLAQVKSADFSAKVAMVDTTTFDSAGNSQFTPTLISGTFKASRFWLSNARLSSLQARDFLIVSFSTPGGNRYEGFCYASDCNIKADVKSTVDEDLTFQLTDEFFNA